MKIMTLPGILAACGFMSFASFAAAANPQDLMPDVPSFSSSNNQAAISHVRPDGVTWGSAGAADFQSFLGDNFTIKTGDNRSINLKLINVIPGTPDINRPSYLPRQQSLIAVLKPSKSDEALLAKSDSQVLDTWHHALGNGKVLINAVKKRGEGYSIEFVLN